MEPMSCPPRICAAGAVAGERSCSRKPPPSAAATRTAPPAMKGTDWRNVTAGSLAGEGPGRTPGEPLAEEHGDHAAHDCQHRRRVETNRPDGASVRQLDCARQHVESPVHLARHAVESAVHVAGKALEPALHIAGDAFE